MPPPIGRLNNKVKCEEAHRTAQEVRQVGGGSVVVDQTTLEREKGRQAPSSQNFMA